MTLHQAKEGEILFYEGDPTLRVWIVLEGVVEVYKCDPKGNAFVLNRFTPPGFIAEMAVLEGIAYPATGRTCAPSLLAMIDAQLFRDKFLGNPRIAGLMISSLSRKIKQLESRLSILLLPAEARIAKMLLVKPSFLMYKTQRAVAQELGMAPETLSRILARWRREGILEGNMLKKPDIVADIAASQV